MGGRPTTIEFSFAQRQEAYDRVLHILQLLFLEAQKSASRAVLNTKMLRKPAVEGLE